MRSCFGRLASASMALCIVLSSCTHDRIRSGGRIRHYVLHVPQSVAASDRPSPLMLVLHGAGGTATGMRAHTRLDVEADRLGYVVAYLEGSGLYRGWRSNESADLRFVTDLIEELNRKTPIDRDRVFVVGYSDGGRFAQRLACALGDQIAAIVSVSATADTALAGACSAASDVSVLFVLGRDDPSVRWDAATPPREASSLTAEQTMAHWATLNGCSLAHVVSQVDAATGTGSAAERRDYSGCIGGTVILYVTNAEGHGWPRTATRWITQFFESINSTVR